MKKIIQLASIAVVGCSMLAAIPAKADTVYHRVYHTSLAASDPFSVLDIHQNNVLTADEYKNAALTVPFGSVDTNRDGFINRQEFYAYYRAPVPENAADLSLVMPAAGGDDDYADEQCRPQY